jgi:hypothetical protein
MSQECFISFRASNYGLKHFKHFNVICSHTKHEGIHFTYHDGLQIYSTAAWSGLGLEFPGSIKWGRYQGHLESETLGTGNQQHIPF